MDSLNLKRYNSFQNQNYRKATLILLQIDLWLLSFNKFCNCVSWGSIKIHEEFLNLENRSARGSLFLNSNF